MLKLVGMKSNMSLILQEAACKNIIKHYEGLTM